MAVLPSGSSRPAWLASGFREHAEELAHPQFRHRPCGNRPQLRERASGLRLRAARARGTFEHLGASVTFAADPVTLDTGDTAWLLASSALVLLMTPGLAFFYGGLNRSKSVLNMMMMSFSSIGLISILWLLYGFSGAFGADKPLSDSTAGFFGSFGQYSGWRT